MFKYKGIIFDIDGVLCGSKKLHESAFIMALKDFDIRLSHEEHSAKLDGLSTKEKLSILNINKELALKIEYKKQLYTFKEIERYIKFDNTKFEIFKFLKDSGFKIGVCSNAIRDFSTRALEILKLDSFIDILLTNQDVEKIKPSPEIYIKCIKLLNLNKEEVLIFEDSSFGLEAAFKSRANVCIIEDQSYLNLEKVRKYI